MAEQNQELSYEDRQYLVNKMARRKKKRKIEDKAELAINSMMDIMTILLVFLLISITSDPLAIRETAVLKMARSTATFPVVATVPVQVNKKEILVDNKRAVAVACKFNGRPCQEDDLERPGAKFYIDQVNKEHGKEQSLLIVPLKEALTKAVKHLKDQNLELPEEVRRKYMANQGVATLVCDRYLPYRMIAEIVYTTAMAELHDIRFAIVYTETN